MFIVIKEHVTQWKSDVFLIVSCKINILSYIQNSFRKWVLLREEVIKGKLR